MKKKSSSRYDLPSSRILIRSLRYAQARVSNLVGDSSDPEYQSLVAGRALNMVRDLFSVRLLEDRRVLVDSCLRGGKSSRPLEGADVSSRLSDLNEWLGYPMFDPDAWLDPGPGEEFCTLEHELHLSRFWPPGMPVEVLGALWEERLSVPKRTGVFYTPRRIVDMVLDEALDVLEREGVEPVLADPSCGSGYFLLEAMRRLVKAERERDGAGLFSSLVKGESGRMVVEPARRMELVKKRIFGVDLSAGGIELARRSILIEALADLPAFRGTPPSPEPLYSNIKEGDAILEHSFPQQVDLFDASSPPALKPFDWYDEEEGFGKMMASTGINCMVGNPPWVSLKGRHKQAPYSPQVVRSLTERYGSDTYRPNIVEYFVRRAVELLTEGGVNGFVVPDRISENEQYRPLRKFMAENGEITRLHFREPFPGVSADTLVYVFIKRRRPRRSARIRITEAGGKKREVPQSYWVRAEGYLSGERTRDELEQVLRKIETAGRRRLSDFLETGVGFIAKPGRITEHKVSENQQPAIKGEHVTPYRREGNAWIEFRLENLAGGTRRMEKLTRTDRILLRKTGARLTATADSSGDLPEQSLYFAFPRDRRLARPYDLRYFLGILNSKVMTFYFRQRKITNRATTPQIKKVHLDSLPVRPINFNDPEVREMHHGLAQAVRKREAENDTGKIPRLDLEVDRRVAELYGLSSDQFELVLAELEKPRG